MNAGPDHADALQRCATLSRREKEVLRAMGVRRRAKEIARELNISEHTVRGYANEARQKLGLSSTRDAALLFLQFERLQQTPQNQGDQFQWVSKHHTDAAASSGGFSNAPRIDRGPESEVPGRAGGNSAAAAVGPKRLGWLIPLYGWLARLSVTRWFGLTLLLTVGVIMAFGLAAMTVLGVFEVLHQIGGQHR